MKMWWTAGALLMALTLGGCSEEAQRAAGEATDRAVDDASKQVEDELPGVDWDAQFPDTKKLIDRAARQGDCQLLQDTFDVQADRSDVDPALLEYIDAKLKAADCY